MGFRPTLIRIIGNIQAINDVLKDMLAHTDGDEKLKFEQQIEDFTETYNNAVLDEHSMEVKYKKTIEERDKAFAEMEEARAGVRTYIIDCITTNAPNAEAMKELAAKIIASDRRDGLFDALNWKGIV